MQHASLLGILVLVSGVARAGAGPLLATKADEDCRDRPLLCGEVVREALTNRDCSLGGGSVGDRWVFIDGTSEEAFTAAASTATVAAQLSLSGRGIASSSASVPPGGDAALVLDGKPPGVRRVTVQVSTDPSAGNALGDYALGLACAYTRPCTSWDPWAACIGQSLRRPLRRFVLQSAWEDPAQGTYGIGWDGPVPQQLAAYGEIGDELRLFVKLVPTAEHTEVRYVGISDLPYKLGITDLASGETKLYGPAEDGCGGANRDSFPALATPAGRSRCRATANRGCFVDGRFAVEASFVKPPSRRGRKARVRTWSESPRLTSGVVAFTNVNDWEVFVRFEDRGDHVDFAYGSYSDWQYSIAVTDTYTGEVRYYANPAGRLCAVRDATAFSR